MGVQIGIDLVEIGEIEESLRRHGERFLERVYTPAERAQTGCRAAPLAARFAAKEATMKALGRTGEGIGWRSVEVLAAGRETEIRLAGAAGRLAARRGVSALSASLSGDRRLAAAIVVAETEP